MPSAGLDELLVGFDPARYGRATPRFGRDELDRVNAALLQKMPFQAVEERLRALGLHDVAPGFWVRSEEHTSELQSLMRISYAVFCLKKKKKTENSKQLRHQAPS